MRKLFTILAALALLVGFATEPAVQAQGYNAYRPGEQGVGLAVSGLTSYFPILIKYVGASPAGGTVAVDAASGDITLKTGPVGSSTADLTTECPVSGASGGVIDVSDAACNTLGEVVDAINASANWRAVIQDGLRSDTSVNTLDTLAETSASNSKGLALKGDSAVSLNVTLLLYPVRNDINVYISNGTGGFKINKNPFNDTMVEFLRANQTLAGTGADTFKLLFTSEVNNQACTLLASSVSCTASETETIAYQEPGGGTTVNKAFDFSEIGVLGKPGGRVLVRGDFATSLTAVTTFAAVGNSFTYKAIR
jgi:hypothetical protein